MKKNQMIVRAYFDAVSRKDFKTVADLFADDIIWHQPGNGIQSGTYVGKQDVFAHLGNFMQWSGGTFAIDNIEYLAGNLDLVAASIHFEAERNGIKLSMKGIDLLKIQEDKVKEVWLFSESIQEEDEFWTQN